MTQRFPNSLLLVRMATALALALLLAAGGGCSDSGSTAGAIDVGSGGADSGGLDADAAGAGADVQAALDVTIPPADSFADKDALVPDQDATPTDAAADGTDGQVLEPLEITGVSPGSGPSTGGDTVTITGAGFAGNAQVFFGESAASGVFVTDTGALSAQTPPRPPGLVDVRVVNPDTEQQSVLESAYLYYNPVQVVEIEPVEGDVQGGTPVTISGTGFVDGSKVLIGSRAAIGVNVLNDTTILAVTPIGAAGPTSVHVSNPQGVGSLKNGYFYYEEPSIDAITPALGPLTGGNPVALDGAGFMGNESVQFGSTFASVLSKQGFGELVIEAPKADVAGPVDVEVATDYGAVVVPGGYVYIDEGVGNDTVQLVAVSPAEGPQTGGTYATIAAYGLTSAADTTIRFGDAKAQVLGVNPATWSAQVKVPAGAAVGPVDVSLENAKGTSTLVGAFVYYAGVVVSDVTPATGPVTGGTYVTIKGKGFAKGAAVRVGALPANDVVVVDETTITAVSPPGSAGLAPVKVTVGDHSGVKQDAFFYQTDGMELFVVDPNLGSMAGGTLIRLVGTGFPGDAEVLVGGSKATHVTVHDGTLITAKTPPGQVGTVNVEVKSPQGSALLPEAFTYFNPASSMGGTWGGGVEGDVNVSVFDATNGEPVPDAFVILAVDPTTPYQGYTNLQGQVTFSGPDVLGTQQVSASKTAYESNSIVKFNAKNITIFLVPIPPPSPGAPPPGVAPPTVSGKVFGLAKYVLVPIGTCASKLGLPETPYPMCQPCVEGSCGAGFVCSPIGNQGNYCTQACTVPADCPTGFVCGGQGGQTLCLPSPGQKVARCYSTKPNVLAQDLEALIGSWGEKYEVTEDGGDYDVYIYPGESAIVCMGGYVEYDTQEFVPLTMGVARHILAAPGEAYPDHDIELKFPMDRSITVRLDDPPTTNGPELTAVFAYVDFGSDGVIEMKHSLPVQFGDAPLVVERQVKAFTDLIYDASFSFMGGAFSMTDDNLPMSLTLHHDITSVEDDTIVELSDLGWATEHSGIKQTISDLWGTDMASVYGVGPGGLIVHFGGSTWTAQQSPTKEDLAAVFGFGEGDAVIVGKKATVLRYDGIAWKQQPVVGTTSDLVDVWGAAPDDIWAVGFYTMIHFDGAEWKTVPASLGSTMKSWTAIWGADASHVFAVGQYGTISMWNGATWASMPSGTALSLYDVWGTGPDDVYAVGDSGTVLHYDGVAWTLIKADTQSSFKGVWGSGPDDVYAVGSGGAIFHYDGAVWQDQSVEGFKNQLEAIFGFGPDQALAIGSSELLLGPMLEVPKAVAPTEGGALSDYTITFDVAPGVPAHFNYITLGIPGMMGDTPVWTIFTDGSVTEVDLPDFPNIEGTPGIPAGLLKLTLIRVFKEGFDIDNYDYNDFSQLDWRSWAIDVFTFNKL